LDLDFSGRSVGSVAVNGQAASFRRDGQELIITPRRAINHGSLFIVTVSHFVAVPTVPGDDPETSALFVHPDGDGDGARPGALLPCVQRPPERQGVGVSRGRRHAVFLQRQPMATELIQFAVGNYDVTNEGFHSGVFLREVTSRSLTKQYLPAAGPDALAAGLDAGARRRLPVRPLPLARRHRRTRVRAGDPDVRADRHLLVHGRGRGELRPRW
jgi:hypothetical protein